MHQRPDHSHTLPVTRLSLRNVASFEWAVAILLTIILALLLTSKYGTAYRDARETTIVTTLQALRGQIEIYKIQHHDRLPAAAYPWTQLVSPTNVDGQTTAGIASSDFPFGPYIKAPPVNPINGQIAVGAAPSQDVGWVYTVSNSGFTLQAVNTAGDGVLTY